MKRLCLLAITVLLFAGCAAPTVEPIKFGVVMYQPKTQVLTYRINDHDFPNIQFCALTDKDIAESFEGLSVTKTGTVVYAFNRLHVREHPDTWVKLLSQEDASNRWPHSYTFDIDGDGAADVYFLDLKRDGKCDLSEVGQEKTA